MNQVQENIKSKLVVFAGLPRTASTTLYYQLQAHPEVFVPYRKEIHYFCYYPEKDEAWYLDYFTDLADQKIGVDVSPNYFIHAESIDRIKNMLPDSKVVICVREPVDWAVSWYLKLAKYNRDMPEFKTFLKGYTLPFGDKDFLLEPEKINIADNLKAFSEKFSGNVLIYKFDLFKENPLFVMNKIEEFLGLSTFYKQDNFENIALNSSNHKDFILFNYKNQEKLVQALWKIVPKSILQKINNRLHLSISKNKAPSEIPSHLYETSAEVFGPQSKEVDDFFGEHSMVLGNGNPF